MRALRTVTGVLAAGVVVLALVVLGAALLTDARSGRGPQTGVVLAHLVAAVVVVGAQLLSDRQRRPTGMLAGSGVVLVVSAVLLWTQWWA